jgi:hypothetical protein
MMREAIEAYDVEAHPQEGTGKNLTGRRRDESGDWRVCSTESVKRVLRTFNLQANREFPVPVQDVFEEIELPPDDDEDDGDVLEQALPQRAPAVAVGAPTVTGLGVGAAAAAAGRRSTSGTTGVHPDPELADADTIPRPIYDDACAQLLKAKKDFADVSAQLVDANRRAHEAEDRAAQLQGNSSCCTIA